MSKVVKKIGGFVSDLFGFSPDKQIKSQEKIAARAEQQLQQQQQSAAAAQQAQQAQLVSGQVASRRGALRSRSSASLFDLLRGSNL